jgi:DMSO/TMAO reductase YedYZ heme-binding membrane subunit
VAAVGLTAALTLVFVWIGRPEGDYLPLSHRALADVSLVLLCLILMLGAVARLVPRLRPVVPWGRELGIGMFVTAGLHVALLLPSDDSVFGFFREVIFPGRSESPSLGTGANWVGAVALGYALVWAAISNDWSQRKLRRGWKFVQRQAYTLFVLTWIHTAAFVLVGAGHDASLFAWLFWGITMTAVVAQFAGFVHTVRAPRGPSPHQVLPKPAADSSGVLSMRAVRWFGVVALWGVFTVGSLALANDGLSAEERQVANFCERYNELGRPPLVGTVYTELVQLLPGDWEPNDLYETFQMCQDG